MCMTLNVQSAEDGSAAVSSTINEQQESQHQQSPAEVSNNLGSEQKLRSLQQEELRIWSAWLKKVADTAVSEWDEWLLAHINLTLRLHEYLQKAEEAIEREKRQQQPKQAETPEPWNNEKAKATKSQASDRIHDEKEKNEVTYDDIDAKARASSTEISQGGNQESQIEESHVSRKSATEDTIELDKSKESESKTTKFLSDSKDVSKTASQPIISRVELISEGEEIVTIPIPMDEYEMFEIIKEFQLQAKRYHSLYKYWQKMADKVIEEIIEKSTELSGQRSEHTYEEISFFVFLEEEPDIGYYDSDEDVISETGREKITYKNLNLFFNLMDDFDEAETEVSSSNFNQN